MNYRLPKKSKQHKCGAFETLVSIVILTDGKYSIDKSAEYSELTGNQIKNSIIYTVNDDKEEDAIDCFKTLAEAKKFLKSIK